MANVNRFSASVFVPCIFLPAQGDVEDQLQITVAFNHKFDISFKENILQRE